MASATNDFGTPCVIEIHPAISSPSQSGTWEFIGDSANFGLGHVRQNATTYSNSYIGWHAALRQGTWRVEIVYVKQADGTTGTVSWNGTSLGTIDFSGASSNNRFTATMTANGFGEIRIAFGVNPCRGRIQRVTLTRTGP